MLDAKTRANLVSFPAGYGDGSYSSWLGFDGRGNLVCVTIDFNLLASAERLALLARESEGRSVAEQLRSYAPIRQ